MTLDAEKEVAKFDAVAESYSEAHQRSVSASGESPEYFARHKLSCLRRHGVSPSCRVLDYGCGTGQLTRWLASEQSEVWGYDPSRPSLERARVAASGAHFVDAPTALPDGEFDVAVVAGVLHHVPPRQRRKLLRVVLGKLRPGGRAFVFEHNPFNPLTRRAVRDCPFDDDAILLPPREPRQHLERAGFSLVRQDFVLFFPRFLRTLRPLEPLLARCPLGAQTLTMGTRPED